MHKRFHAVLVLGISSLILQIAAGDYDVLVRFLEYNRDRDFDCDGLFVSGGECDVYFKVCLQPLSPEQMQTCRGSDSDELDLENTYHLVFSRALWRYFTYYWRGVRGQPIFNILVHVYDLDPVGDDDYLGVTSYIHVGSGSTVRTVTTTPSHKNLREICRRKNSNILLENTHYFLFSPAQNEDYTFRWGNIRGKPIFNILIKVFDLDPVGEDDFLGTTSYNHVGSGPTVRNVTTTPAGMNLR
uniref:Uncharacterized protein n=1 Tax=Magallana gigas TaxID=29159 RepID=A0A8W8JQB5_MAGGI